MARSVVLACLVALGCGRGDSGKATATKTNPPSGPDCAKAKQHGALKWIEDDYQAALG